MITNHQYADAPLFNIDSTDKQILVTIKDKPDVIDNTLLNDDGMQLLESLCEEDQLHFGSCCSCQIKLTMDVNACAYSLEGMTIYVKMYLDGHTGTVLNIGTYKVVSDQKNANADNRIITAYDALKEINEADVTSWYNTLLPSDNSTTTLKSMRDSFFSHFGVTQETVDLPNDTMVIRKTYTTPLSGKTVIEDICEANGVFGHINRDGKFIYLNIIQNTIPLYPADDLYPSDTLYPSDGFNRVMSMLDSDGGYIDGEFENYSVQKIDCLEILAETGDVGQTIGSGANIYTIQDNALFFGMSAAELTTYGTKVFDAIKNATYTPYELEALGSPCYEVGDGIKCQTYNGIVTSYILKRTLTGVQALIDDYSAKGEPLYTVELNTIRSQVERNAMRGNILRRDVDETMSEIYDQYGYSRITQNANAITAEVSRAEGAEGSLSSRISVNAGNIALCVKKDTNYSGIEISTSGVKVVSTAGSFVVDSTNFKVDGNGNVTASNVDLTGKITATSGKIGALKLDNNWLSYNPSGNTLYKVLSYSSQDQAIQFGSNSFSTIITGFDLRLSCGSNSINLVSLTGSMLITCEDAIAGLEIKDGSLNKRCKWVKISDFANEDPDDYVMVGIRPYSP